MLENTNVINGCILRCTSWLSVHCTDLVFKHTMIQEAVVLKYGKKDKEIHVFSPDCTAGM